MIGKYEEQAREFCEAIRALGEREDALENLKMYLSRHFGAWLDRFANSPDGMAAEMAHFANLYD